MEPGALGRRRRRGGAFSIAQLFANGEAGGVYDPAQLTAEKVAWRRNLLTWSQEFDNAAWAKITSGVGVAPVVTANAGLAPDGTMTADRVQFDCANTGSASNRSIVQQAVALAIGVTYTRFVSLKAWDAGNVGKTVRVSSDGISGGTTVTLTADWQTVTLTGVAIGTSGALLIETRGTITTQTADVLMWGAQFENNATATAYQRITDFTSDFLAAFPTHSLYQDAAGTTPVTALGQPVALVIDTKTGGLANLGPELAATLPTPSIQNVGGSNGTWTAGTRTMANTATGTDAGYPRFAFDFGLTANARYRVSGRLSGNLASLVGVRLATAGSANELSYNSATGVFFGVQVTAGSVLEFRMNGTLAATQSLTIESLSVQLVPGVHAIQATSASRPLLDGRVNLLTRTEEFDNAAWIALRGTVAANATTAPNGTSTADRFSSTSNDAYLYVNGGISLAAASYRFGVYAKADSVSAFRLDLVTAAFGLGASCTFTLTGAGAASAVTHYGASSGFVANITSEGNGWYFCTLTGTTTVATWFPEMQLPTSGQSVFFCGADLRLATDAAYPYQRVTTATDYADVGAPRSFLFDGIDDSLYTASNMDLSGTDKVTVLAGVRKLSDAASAMLAELGPNAVATNGTFGLLAPSSSGANSYRFISRGATTQVSAGTGVFAAAPDTSVLVGIGNIGAPLCELRRNAASVQATTSTQGGGNYTSNLLNIGRSNNASLPLNGKVYQLIVRGALTDAATLAQAERYVGARTGVFL